MELAAVFGVAFVGSGILIPVLTEVLNILENQVRSFIRVLVSMVVIRITSQAEVFATVVADMAGTTGKNTGHEEYSMFWRFVKPLGEYRNVVVQWVGKTWRFWRYRNAWVLVIPSDDASEVDLYWLRGQVDRNVLLRDIEEAQDRRVKSEKKKNFRIIRHYGSLNRKGGGLTPAPDPTENAKPPQNMRSDGWSPVLWRDEDIGEDVQGVEVEALSLTQPMRDFIDRVKFWHEDRAWYRDRGIAHQLGALFYGSPGTGKTSLARAIAAELDIPVHVLDLASMTNQDLYDNWTHTRSNSVRMVLLEDFGNVFKLRKNVAAAKGGVTFDALLEVIGGIEREDGLLLIITTNHLEEIDEALGVPDETGMSSRPGRLDLMLEFGAMDRDGRVKLANKILRDQVRAEKVADENQDRTPAQIQEICVSMVQKERRARVAA